jgi:hypothetical protein
MKSPGVYIEAYSKLDKADTDGRVVVSMTIHPKNLGNVENTIKSILDQTVKVDEIAINMPPGDYTVPAWLKKVAVIYRTGSKHGSLDAIIPTILREGEKDTTIIIIENGVIYGVTFIDDIVKASKKYKDTALYTTSNTRNGLEIIETMYGVLVKPEFFNVKDVDGVKKDTDIDIWITEIMNKGSFKKKKIGFTENIRALKRPK